MSIFILKSIHFLFSFTLTFFFLKTFIPTLRKIFPVIPNERGMHSIVKPSSGGISFIVIYFLLALYQGFFLPLFSIPLAIIGVVDDKFNLSKFVRFFSQLLTIFLIIFYLKNDPNNIVSLLTSYGFLGYFILLIFGTSVINFINFMDGIDGLICGSMIVIFSTLNGGPQNLTPLIGTLTAFLYFNWYPSKIFMGDAGSLFLGSYLVSIMYSSSGNIIGLFKICLLSSPILMDAASCILRRFINKKNIFNAHKSHLYQRLVSNGYRHSTVSIIYILAISTLSIFYLFSSTLNLFLASVVIFIMGIFVDIKYAVSFNKS